MPLAAPVAADSLVRSPKRNAIVAPIIAAIMIIFSIMMIPLGINYGDQKAN